MHVLVAEGSARADDANATAEELFQQARVLVDAGNYHVDLDKLAASIVDDESFRAKAPK